MRMINVKDELPVKILAICGRENEYPRNKFILDALSSHHQISFLDPLPRSISILWRSIFGAVSVFCHLTINRYDLIYIGFYGQLITLLISPFTRRPILLDAFISTYDTLVNDRKIFREGSIGAKLARWLDKQACKRAKLVFLDTQTQCDYFSQEFKLDITKLKRVFVSCDQSIFYPMPKPLQINPLILTYSTFLPIHGTRYVLEAARSLPQVSFQLIGKGMELEAAKAFVNDNKLANLTFYPPVPLKQLPQFMVKADIFLGGHFGTSHKARSVIAAKTFQALAMGLPTIVTDNPANRELFGDDLPEAFCEHGSSESLRVTILRLLNNDDLRAGLGTKGFKIFTEMASQETVRNEILVAVSGLLR